MSKKISIRKVLLLIMWLVIGGGMLTLLIAAMGRQNKEACKGYEINVEGSKQELFLDKQEIVKLLTAAARGPITGQQMGSFNLHKMEQLLEDNNWVRNAELYFDSRNVLHVNVTERVPVARIFNTGGRSFYIDTAGQQLPLSDKITARVPVFSGFPVKNKYTKADSAVLKEMVGIASFVDSDPFWSAQVSQIDLVTCGDGCWTYEMTPVVGNHIVRLGDGKDIEKKFRRLYVFYQQVLSKTGLDRYPVVDVGFAGQVVGVKGTPSKVDSIQLRRNVEDLLRQSRQMNDMMEVMPAVQATRPLVPSAELGETEERSVEDTVVRTPATPVVPSTPARTTPQTGNSRSNAAPAAPRQADRPAQRTTNNNNNSADRRTPRAVMPPRRANN
jgi:cell division protein FtsQ